MRGATVLIGVLLAGAVSAQSRDPLLEVLRMQLEMEQRVLALDLANYTRVQDQLRDAADRMVRLGDDLLRAEEDGEDAGSLAARSSDLRRAESDVAELMAMAQQIRTTIASRRTYTDQVGAEIRRLEEALQTSGDEISGRWQVAVDPGGQRGTFDLKLDGTLVSGSYQLSGGFRGSLRGTFINGTMRVERIDAQLGFVAIFTGRLAWRDGEKRLEGSWESTNLSSGMPASGSWVARREAGR
ncbi:MAG: hypothetical protein AB1625_02245 [Acidobacteriota bacterium]